MHWFRPGLLIVGAALAILGATPSYAQLNAQGTGLNTTGTALQHTLRDKNDGKPEAAAPPVLPGTKGPSEAAQPTTSPTDMTPTEGLFDAINRGDLAAARDAVNRGAELNGHNVLGLTPLELSVDLGHNDLSFMLLSMRGDSSAVRAEARAGAQGGAVRRSAENEPPRAVTRPRVIAAAAREPADEEPVYATPRYSSGDGGTPIPAAGFLGFSGR